MPGPGHDRAARPRFPRTASTCPTGRARRRCRRGRSCRARACPRRARTTRAPQHEADVLVERAHQPGVAGDRALDVGLGAEMRVVVDRVRVVVEVRMLRPQLLRVRLGHRQVLLPVAVEPLRAAPSAGSAARRTTRTAPTAGRATSAPPRAARSARAPRCRGRTPCTTTRRDPRARAILSPPLRFGMFSRTSPFTSPMPSMMCIGTISSEKPWSSPGRPRKCSLPIDTTRCPASRSRGASSGSRLRSASALSQ